jgi:hypothetical protein
LLAAAGLLLLLTGCRAQHAPLPQTFDGAAAYDEVRRLIEISPRDAGTPGARQAAAHIAQRLRVAGVQPEIITFTDPTPSGPLEFHTVSAQIAGRRPDRVVLVSHFDTKRGMPPEFTGANDSGSSTGVLLELARQLHAIRPEFTLEFLFVDGEECQFLYGPQDGLHGSRQAAARLKQGNLPVRAVIVIDMIGDADWRPTIPRNADARLAATVMRAAESAGLRDRIRLGPAMLDDHVPFLEAGFPAVDLIDFTYGSAPGLNDYWHTREDTLDKISPRSLEHTGRLLLHLLCELESEARGWEKEKAGRDE